MENAVVVPHPPPAALPEIVPPEPDRPGATWIDGAWRWRGDAWIWHRGGWQALPEDAVHVPWQLAYGDDGTLYWSDRRFVTADGTPTEPELIEPAGYPPVPRLSDPVPP